MIRWELVSDNTGVEIWDKSLVEFPDYNIYQTYAWGQHKGNFGWIPQRFMAYDPENNVVAMFQVLLRRYPGNILMLWGSGGPVGGIENWDDSLQQAFIHEFKSNRVYCRIFPQRAYQSQDALALRAYAWTRCMQTLNSGISMMLELDDESQFIAGMTKNWRHNLNRSKKLDLSISHWENPDIDDIIQVYESMQDYKGLEVQYSKNELVSLLQAFNKRIVIYRCMGSQGEILGFRACAVIGDKAWDFLAATNVEGRKTYASYALFVELIKHCRSLGVKYYDFSGIDPLTNKGVYDFKKGTGAKPIEYLGEWDWSTSEWLKWGINWAIRKKGGRL